MNNILLAVTGLSPQVITEALYALHQEGRSIHAIHIITTREGKDCISARLLSPKDGLYNRYLSDYHIDPDQIKFSPENIHVLCDETGREITDIIDEEDNEALLKTCLELTFALTSEENTALFFLVAGGRKTMTSCLTLAAQIYGRPQDRIYHVLVSPEFEGSRNFYYPPPEATDIELKDSKGDRYTKSTRYARITLCPIPFISIRDRLSDKMLAAPLDPATLMLSAIREPRPVLTVNIQGKKLIYKGIELDLQPSLMALYTFFALQKNGCTSLRSSCKNCHDCYLPIQEVYGKQDKITDIYLGIARTDPFFNLRSDNRITKLDPEAFNEYKAKIKKAILHRFGPQLLPRFEIGSVGKRPDKRYGIDWDKGRIRVDE